MLKPVIFPFTPTSLLRDISCLTYLSQLLASETFIKSFILFINQPDTYNFLVVCLFLFTAFHQSVSKCII